MGKIHHSASRVVSAVRQSEQPCFRTHGENSSLCVMCCVSGSSVRRTSFWNTSENELGQCLNRTNCVSCITSVLKQFEVCHVTSALKANTSALKANCASCATSALNQSELYRVLLTAALKQSEWCLICYERHCEYTEAEATFGFMTSLVVQTGPLLKGESLWPLLLGS